MLDIIACIVCPIFSPAIEPKPINDYMQQLQECIKQDKIECEALRRQNLLLKSKHYFYESESLSKILFGFNLF